MLIPVPPFVSSIRKSRSLQQLDFALVEDGFGEVKACGSASVDD